MFDTDGDIDRFVGIFSCFFFLRFCCCAFVEFSLMEQNINDINSERTYTQTEMENIIRNVVQQMDSEKEERVSGTNIPLEISSELETTPVYQLHENFRQFKKDTQRYNLDEWTTPEKINKTIILYLKRHSTETNSVVNAIRKHKIPSPCHDGNL